jgi:hypothetical protein
VYRDEAEARNDFQRKLLRNDKSEECSISLTI